MSVLLRQPATVPALFSRAVEADRAASRPAAAWRRLMPGAARPAALGWAAVVLVEVPLVKAATALLGVTLPG